ncbi:hypothetical protein [Palleronia abyssalis]|uniref:Uncharacterized protein n=1 Tax=Palleronia abyssalis TaxID=1501240 RepID=A0A2R8BRW2_9RHOB|nr:hypothetical protein [Palleronia abyssalis]SPJ22899.1 hypothetical protein PAA8504_00698 [Palleronia abyssalis]
MALGLAWFMVAATPLAMLLFLTSFLVWMGQGTRDTWFTRFCDRAVVPSGIAVLLLVAATLRWF